MGRKSHWTPAEIAVLELGYAVGHSVEEIAAELGRSKPGVYYQASVRGLKKRTKSNDFNREVRRCGLKMGHMSDLCQALPSDKLERLTAHAARRECSLAEAAADLLASA